MIIGLTGTLTEVLDHGLALRVDALTYELLVSGHTRLSLVDRVGEVLSLRTIYLLEGAPNVGTLTPRLIGFVSDLDHALFQRLTRVKGLSTRKALRAMSVPAPQIAAAIQSGDAELLTTLPEIGKRTAQSLIVDLRDQVDDLLSAEVARASLPEAEVALTDAQRVAVEILVQWGDRRSEAERWARIALERDPELESPEAIVRAAYEAKRHAS